MNIEETIYTNAMASNTNPVLERLKNLMINHGTNNVGDLRNILEVRECMYLLNAQFGSADMGEYLMLVEAREEWQKFVGTKVNFRERLDEMIEEQESFSCGRCGHEPLDYCPYRENRTDDFCEGFCLPSDCPTELPTGDE